MGEEGIARSGGTVFLAGQVTDYKYLNPSVGSFRNFTLFVSARGRRALPGVAVRTWFSFHPETIIRTCQNELSDRRFRGGRSGMAVMARELRVDSCGPRVVSPVPQRGHRVYPHCPARRDVAGQQRHRGDAGSGLKAGPITLPR